MQTVRATEKSNEVLTIYTSFLGICCPCLESLQIIKILTCMKLNSFKRAYRFHDIALSQFGQLLSRTWIM